MTTPSNNQDPAKNETPKTTNPFQQTNLFKETNPFFTTKLDAPSGGLFNSAASNISQQDGKTGIFGDNTNNLFNQGNAQATSSGLFGARAQPKKEGSKQDDKTSAPFATGTSSSTTNWPSFNKTQAESTKQENTSASAGFLGSNKPSEKQETKTITPLTTGGLFGTANGGGLFGGAKAQTEALKQEPKAEAPGLFGKTQGDAAKPTSGGLFGLTKPSEPKETEKQEAKTEGPPATGMFGSTTGSGIFGSKQTPAQGEVQKQENSSNKPAAEGLFGSIATKGEDKAEKKEIKTTPSTTGGLFASGGLFGGTKVQTEAPKQETNSEAPGMFGKTQGDAAKQASGGLFGLNKPAEPKEAEKQEIKTIIPPTTGIFGGGSGLFGKTQGAPAKQETTLPTVGVFGGQTPLIGATTGTTNPQNSSTMFQAREAPTKKRKDETSTLSPEKKTTTLNITGLPTTGVQSSLLSQPSKTTNLFTQTVKEEPKKSQAPVDDSKLDAILKSAIAKEEKITQKIKDITSKMNNAQVVDQFLKEQNQAIDEFYAEFTQNLAKRVTEIADQQKQALKKKLSDEVQEFKKATEELTGHFNKLLAENSLTAAKDQLLSAAKNKKDAEEAVKSALATSFELENGFSPLVKKYKAIKYTIPSLSLLSKPIDRQPATKQTLLEKAEVVLPELEKVIQDINLALTDAIGSLSHPLKAYLPKISKCVELENSLLTSDFPFELPGVSSEENTIPRDSKIREVVYKIHKNEAEKLRSLNILSKDGEEELVLRVKPVSVRYDIVPGDLMLVKQAPCEIKSKSAPQGTNDIEFELENVLTGIPQNEKLHSKWDQDHELVLTENFVLVKPNNSQKGYYTLMNLKDSKSTRGLVKAIKTDRTLNNKLEKELETILVEEKRALVQVLRIKGEDIIVSCQKLRR